MRHFWRKEGTEEKIEGAFRFFSRRGDIRNGMQEREPHSKKKKTCCRPRCAINVSGISGVDWKWSVSFWLAWPIQKFWKYAKTTVTLIVEIFKVLLKKSEYARCELPPTKLGMVGECNFQTFFALSGCYPEGSVKAFRHAKKRELTTYTFPINWGNLLKKQEIN